LKERLTLQRTFATSRFAVSLRCFIQGGGALEHFEVKDDHGSDFEFGS
jgi:hypothetical protein